ncbi:MAG TPA: acyltransferase domain-containing protein, partial [Streptomyces sp.]
DLTPTRVARALTRRTAFDHRAVVWAGARDELLTALAHVASGTTADAPNIVTGSPVGAPKGKTAFLFTGQGSQRPGMGAQLYAAYPAFAAALVAVCAAMDAHLERPLLDVMFAAPDTEDAALLDQTAYTQPALFALEVALYRLLESYGITPDYLAGHSIGEITAAHVAGVLDLTDACTLVATRGRLMQSLPAGGAMAAVQATEQDILTALADHPDVTIAAVNGPTSVVISGTEADVATLTEQWQAEGRKTKRLTVSHAFHSPLMDPILDDFQAVLNTLTFQTPTLPVISNLTGQPASGDDLTTPDYWIRHAREAVRFHDTLTWLGHHDITLMLELGPDAILTTLAQDTDTTCLPTLRHGRPETATLTNALGTAHAHGLAVDWAALLPASARRVELPTYPFARQRYWLAPSAPATDATGLGQAATDHPLLGAAIELADGNGLVLTGRLSLATHPWLADHAVLGTVIVPGTALVEMALHAARRTGHDHLDELTLHAPLVIPDRGAVQLQLTVTTHQDTGQAHLTVHSRPDEGADGGDDGGDNDRDAQPWTQHATGVLTSAQEPPQLLATTWPPPGAEPVDIG